MGWLGQGPLVKATCIYFAALALLLIPFIQREAVFMHRVRWPPFSAYNSPEKYGFMPNAWRSFHVTTSDGVSIGATQVLPIAAHERALASLDNNLTASFPIEVYERSLQEVPTILYLHGNAATRMQRLRRELSRAVTEVLGLNFLAIDYRSFGDSERVAPSEEGLVIDARAAWDWLTKERGVDANQIAVMGHSLGTGVAAQLAAELAAEGIHPRALILSAPFASFRMLLRTYRLFKIFPILSPFRSVPKLQNLLLDCVQTRFDTFDVLPRSNCPVLLHHAVNDVDIPVSHSRGLAAMLSGLKPKDDQAVAEIEMQPLIKTPAQSLGDYGSLQEFKTAAGRRVMLLESVYGSHDGGQASQMMLRFIKEIMHL